MTAGVRTAATQTIDQTWIAGLRSSSPELLERLIGIFLKHANVTVRELSKAAEQENLGALENLAHNLKSSSGNLGATTMADYCRELEQAAKDRRAADASLLVSAITACYADVSADLAREAQRLAASRTQRPTGRSAAG